MRIHTFKYILLKKRLSTTKCHGFFGVNVDRDLYARSLQLKMKPTTHKNKIRLDNEMNVWLCRTAKTGAELPCLRLHCLKFYSLHGQDDQDKHRYNIKSNNKEHYHNHSRS